MRIRGEFRMLLLGLFCTPLLLGQRDAREIIRRSIAADERNWSIARSYGFMQRVELLRLDARGIVRLADVQTYEVTLQEGTPYRRLVQRADRPLLAKEQKKELESFVKSVTERRQETGAERVKRLSAYERRPDWQREAWRELAEAFDFRLVGEGTLDGHNVFIIEAMPHTGYQAQSRTAKLFRSIKGKFWVDQQDHQIMKVEAEAIDTIWIGVFLVRVSKGARATLELTQVSNRVWLPNRLQVFALARLGLFKALRIEQSVNYSHYTCIPYKARMTYPANGSREIILSSQYPLGN